MHGQWVLVLAQHPGGSYGQPPYQHVLVLDQRAEKVGLAVDESFAITAPPPKGVSDGSLNHDISGRQEFLSTREAARLTNVDQPAQDNGHELAQDASRARDHAATDNAAKGGVAL